MSLKSIVIVCGAGYVSGKEVMAIELGCGLAEIGCRVFVATSSWNNGDFPDRLGAHQLPFETMPLGFISKQLDASNLKMTGEQLLKWPRLALAYRSMLKRERPSAVVHTNWHHSLLLWPFLNPDRDLFWLHEVLPEKPRYRRFITRLARRIGKFVCVSKAVADSLKRLGAPPDKVVVIHNGLVDPTLGGVERASSRSETLRVGIVGQVGAWKGHQDVIEALAVATRKNCDAQLAVYGQGDESFVAHLKDSASELGISDKVSWHGYERDRARIYNQLDVCTVPSRSHDPLPTTAIEAGFFGLPVIATSRGGLPEIVEDGQTGFLVDAEAPNQIADCICRLYLQPELRERMGQAARKHAIEKFSCRRFITEFSETIDRTVHASKSA